MAEELDSLEIVAATVAGGDGGPLLGSIDAVLFFVEGVSTDWTVMWGSYAGHPIGSPPTIQPGVRVGYEFVVSNLCSSGMLMGLDLTLSKPSGSSAEFTWYLNYVTFAPFSSGILLGNIMLDKPGTYQGTLKLMGELA